MSESLNACLGGMWQGMHPDFGLTGQAAPRGLLPVRAKGVEADAWQLRQTASYLRLSVETSVWGLWQVTQESRPPLFTKQALFMIPSGGKR